MYHEDPKAARTILDSVNDGVFTVDREWRINHSTRLQKRSPACLTTRLLARGAATFFGEHLRNRVCSQRDDSEQEPIVNKAIYVIDAEGRQVPISISTAILRDGMGKIVGGVRPSATSAWWRTSERNRGSLHLRRHHRQEPGHAVALRSSPVVAESDSTVLIRGASGTGKELVARAIHSLSPRKRKRFVAINCGALPDTLLESELFGHKAGAFTDARKDKPGRFAIADGGTIFLDEIGDVSPAMQVRLLRVLQERVYEPLGSVDPVAVDVRVITATHRDLEARS